MTLIFYFTGQYVSLSSVTGDKNLLSNVLRAVELFKLYIIVVPKNIYIIKHRIKDVFCPNIPDSLEISMRFD